MIWQYYHVVKIACAFQINKVHVGLIVAISSFALLAQESHLFLFTPQILYLLWNFDFQMKCKIDFHVKKGLWPTKQQSSTFCP